MVVEVNPAQVIQRAFQGITSEEAVEMVNVGKVTQYPPEVLLCQEGAIETTFYILLEGVVRVTKVINEVEARHLGDLMPGEFFGEMSIIHNAPRNASVMCLQPCKVLEIHKDDFDNLVRH